MRISATQSLRLWHKTMMESVLDDAPDLTIRQLTILLTVYLDNPPHTVRGLATKLNVTKPVITRALNAMGKLELIDRKRDENDGRNVIIQRTVKGSNYLEKLADMISENAKDL